LGNALFSNAQSVPVRTKAVSGLLECASSTSRLCNTPKKARPVKLLTFEPPVSEKTKNLQPIVPHALSVSSDGHVLLALDTHAHAGPGGGGRDLLAWGTNYDYQIGNGKRASIAVPTTLETADGNRVMLGKYRAKIVRDPQGRVWRRGVNVEQVAIGGHGNSLVYWRIA
jgi:hypothetical protein